MKPISPEFRSEYLPTLEVPAINPVAQGVHRPFWSVMVPTYNRPEYLEETLKSILKQDPGPQQMQIEVVDNCSTIGAIESLVRRVGRGRVEYFRQESNLGHFLNGLTCLARSRGHWLHILHDDDMVLPDFYHANERLIERHPDASLLIGPSIHIDEKGRATMVSNILANEEGPVPDFLLRQALWNQVSTPSAVVPRWVYEQIGGFSRNLKWGNDWEMWYRAGSVGRVVTGSFPRSVYRTHPDSDHMSQLISGWSRKESIRIIDMLCTRLPEEQQRRLPRSRYRDLADALVYYSHYLKKHGRLKESLNSIRSAAQLNPVSGILLEFASALRRYPWTGGRITGAIHGVSQRFSFNGKKSRGPYIPTGKENPRETKTGPGTVEPCGSPSVTSTYLQFLARSRGIEVIHDQGVIRLQRGADEIRISSRHPVYIRDMIVGFDYYFYAVYPIESSEGRIVDYSVPRLHRLRISGVEFEFPSLPESDETTDIYRDGLDVQQGDVILDLGAYAGASAYFLSRAVGPGGIVAAFEPDPANVRFLRANVERHKLSNVKVFEKGIWDETTSIEFQSEGNLGSSAAMISGRASNATPVEVVSLAEAASLVGAARIAGIKMDIEGAELKVLRNSIEFLRKHRPRMIIEPHSVGNDMNTNSLCDVLTSLDYDVEIVSQGSLDWPLIIAIPRVSQDYKRSLLEIAHPVEWNAAATTR